MVCTIDRLCGMNLATAAIVYGWLGVIWEVYEAFKNIIHYAIQPTRGERLAFYLCLGLLDLAISVSLIVAAKKRSHTLLLPCLIMRALVLIIVVPGCLIIIINILTKDSTEGDDPYDLVYYIFLFIMSLVFCYVWIGILSLYHVFKHEKFHASNGYRDQVI